MYCPFCEYEENRESTLSTDKENLVEFRVIPCPICKDVVVIHKKHTALMDAHLMRRMENMLRIVAEVEYKDSKWHYDYSQHEMETHFHIHARPIRIGKFKLINGV